MLAIANRNILARKNRVVNKILLDSGRIFDIIAPVKYFYSTPQSRNGFAEARIRRRRDRGNTDTSRRGEAGSEQDGAGREACGRLAAAEYLRRAADRSAENAHGALLQRGPEPA